MASGTQRRVTSYLGAVARCDARRKAGSVQPAGSARGDIQSKRRRATRSPTRRGRAAAAPPMGKKGGNWLVRAGIARCPSCLQGVSARRVRNRQAHTAPTLGGK